MKLHSLLLISACLLFYKVELAVGHGRLMDPPARNSMWRFGFDTPVEFTDNALNCGGPEVVAENGGKCGLCGDDFALKKPKYTAGGRFARGIIGRQYKVGQRISVEVEITANHWGRFEMYVCPANDPSQEATESCFERFPLYLAETKSEVKFVIPKDFRKRGIFRYKVRLPPYLTCKRCVMQWTYYTGRLFGPCNNGSQAIGCAPANTFRNCADIAIVAGSQGGNYRKPNPAKGERPVIESPTFTFFGEDSGSSGNDTDHDHTGHHEAPMYSANGTPLFENKDENTPAKPTYKPEFLGNFPPSTSTTGRPVNNQWTASVYYPPTTTRRVPSTTTVGTTRRPPTTTTSVPSWITRTTQSGPTKYDLSSYSTPSIPFSPEIEDNSIQYKEPPAELPQPVRYQVCLATALFKKLYGADEWCMQSCMKFPPNCPPKMCTCPDTCDAGPALEGRAGAESGCQGLCIVYPYKCHEEHQKLCKCYKAETDSAVYGNYFEFNQTMIFDDT